MGSSSVVLPPFTKRAGHITLRLQQLAHRYLFGWYALSGLNSLLLRTKATGCLPVINTHRDGAHTALPEYSP